jgi:MerR family transcriptional regulator, copper efflux regulator
MKISELSKRTEIGIEAIRSYERAGLISTPRRAVGGHREYGEETIKRLKAIRNARALGFPLAEIGELLSLIHQPQGTSQDIRDRTTRKIKFLRDRIDALQETVNYLQELVDGCFESAEFDEERVLNTLGGDTLDH